MAEISYSSHIPATLPREGTLGSPDVDVVIPTFNCAALLERCLQSLRNQSYDGRMVLWIVDGGSTDRTLEVARKSGARVFVNAGQYGTGLNGARHFGEVRGSAPYVWIIDSDNFIVERTALRELVRALEADPSIQFAVPLADVDPLGSSFSNFIALDELINVQRITHRGEWHGSNSLIDDMDYGLTNATVIRRTALEKVGGYDSDVRVLRRLRRLRLARAVVVTSAHFYHDQASSWTDYRRKWSRRIVRFGRMRREDVREYFVEPSVTDGDSTLVVRGGLDKVTGIPIRAVRGFLSQKDPRWLWGLTFPVLFGSILLRHPVLARRALLHFSLRN